MPKTIIKIRSWRCPSCDYSQDFDPADAAAMALHFPRVAAGTCPACAMGKNPSCVRGKSVMRKETNPAKKVTIIVKGVEDIEAELASEDVNRLGLGQPALSVAEKAAYRTENQADIAGAIVDARKLEDIS